MVGVLAPSPPVNVLVANPTATTQSVVTSPGQCMQAGQPGEKAKPDPPVKSVSFLACVQKVVSLLEDFLQRKPGPAATPEAKPCDSSIWVVLGGVAALGIVCWTLVKILEASWSKGSAKEVLSDIRSLDLHRLFEAIPPGHILTGDLLESCAKLIRAFKE